jgi:hypothetical protein
MAVLEVMFGLLFTGVILVIIGTIRKDDWGSSSKCGAEPCAIYAAG